MPRPPERQTAALVEAGMILASELDLDQLLQRIADLARDLLDAQYAAVGVLGEEGTLSRFVYSGIDQATADRIGELPLGKGLLGVLIEEGRPLRLRHIQNHPKSFGFPEHHPPMESFLGVPITVRGRIFGRLYLTEKRGAVEFTKDDERLALTLASQAGIAVENARLYDEVTTRTEELAQRLAEIASVERLSFLVRQAGSIGDVLSSACEEAVRLTGGTRTTIALLDEGTGELVIREAKGELLPGLIGSRLTPGSSKAHGVLNRGVGEVVEDLGSDNEVHERTHELLGHPRGGVFVPLTVGDRKLGTLAVYNRLDGKPFHKEDISILQIVANQVAIALENERLGEALHDMAILEERDRISKELHDGVIQSIYSVGLSLQGSLALMERDPSTATERIDAVIATLDDVVRDVRSYIFELKPRAIEDRPFADVLKELARDLEVNTLATATLELDCGDELDEKVKSNVVQMVREILSNIARHAEASEVLLACRTQDARLTLEIEDNGIGFDPASVKKGQGLRNISERVDRLGGSVRIVPRDVGGTKHEIFIPLGGSSE